MFESAQKVSVMDSNFYPAEAAMEIKFQRNLTHVTSPSSAYFYHGLGLLRRIPPSDPENIFPIFFTLKTVFLGIGQNFLLCVSAAA